MRLDILYEDDDLVVVDKPAGVVCERGPGSDEPTLADHLRDYLHRRRQMGIIIPLHRLDRETTGAIVFAKSRIGGLLEEAIRTHRVVRTYLALVTGRVEAPHGRLVSYLEKGDFGRGRKVRVTAAVKGPGPKVEEAITEYHVLERYGRATLLELKPHTGRTHQLRVQMAEIGHPIVGDSIYGTQGGAGFMALHASEIGFTHPKTAKLVRAKAPLPRRFAELVNKLREGV